MPASLAELRVHHFDVCDREFSLAVHIGVKSHILRQQAWRVAVCKRTEHQIRKPGLAVEIYERGYMQLGVIGRALSTIALGVSCREAPPRFKIARQNGGVAAGGLKVGIPENDIPHMPLQPLSRYEAQFP